MNGSLRPAINQGYQAIRECRISGDKKLIPVLSLGEQALTGVFPTSPTDKITRGPLELVWSQRSGLLQLAHSFDAGEMYGEGYGYRSGLNPSMVEHLTSKAKRLERICGLT